MPQAVDRAVGANHLLLQARERLGEFRQLVRQAWSEALPRLEANVSVQYTRDPGLRNSPFFSRLLEGPDALPPEALLPFSFTNYVYRLDLEQPIYTFGRVSHAIRGAREEFAGIQQDVRTVENQVARDVAVACYALLLSSEQLRVLETERKARERQLQQVQDRYDVEDATRLDVLRSQVALANLRPELLAAANAVEVASARVNETLGRPVVEPVEITETLQVPEPRPRVARFEALMELAEEHRPELRRYRQTRRVYEERVGVTRSDTLPSLDANFSWGINTFAVENLKDFGLRTWTAGVNMKWTLFDGWATDAVVRQLRSQSTQNAHQEQAFRLDLARQVEQALGDWRRALEAAGVAELAVEQAQEAERVAEESFRWGAATTLDLVEAERGLREAQWNRAQAAHDALSSLSQLKYLVGFRADAPHSVLEVGDAPAAAETEGSHE
jgi:HAE1 family hydrophobic/amphiphilic exporter-1